MNGCYFCAHKSVLRPFLQLIYSHKKDAEELGTEEKKSLCILIGLPFPLHHVAVFVVNPVARKHVGIEHFCKPQIHHICMLLYSGNTETLSFNSAVVKVLLGLGTKTLGYG